ncbi:MAG: hypothetical protein ACN6NT_01285, partial [Comamonas sp.]
NDSYSRLSFEINSFYLNHAQLLSLTSAREVCQIGLDREVCNTCYQRLLKKNEVLQPAIADSPLDNAAYD